MATNWSERTKPTTNWGERVKPMIYAAPLQDAYRIVHDQDNEIIYILVNEWEPIPTTRWKKRKTI